MDIISYLMFLTTANKHKSLQSLNNYLYFVKLKVS